MTRLARIVIPGVAHHVTRRGNRRLPVFFSDEDRISYLALLAEAARPANRGLGIGNMYTVPGIRKVTLHA